MQRPTVIVVSDHPQVFEKMRRGLEPELDALMMFPHAESVVAATAALMPQAVVVDLSRRSVRCGAMAARVLEELPDARVVLLLDKEANPDVKRREWLESGMERDKLGPELTRCLDRAFGGKVRAIDVDMRAPRGATYELAYYAASNR